MKQPTVPQVTTGWTNGTKTLTFDFKVTKSIFNLQNRSYKIWNAEVKMLKDWMCFEKNSRCKNLCWNRHKNWEFFSSFLLFVCFYKIFTAIKTMRYFSPTVLASDFIYFLSQHFSPTIKSRLAKLTLKQFKPQQFAKKYKQF